MLAATWDSTLVILLPGMSRAIEIKDARNAQFVLAERWPVTYGPAFQRALAFCARATEGKCSPTRARLALLAAAREAKVAVVEQHDHFGRVGHRRVLQTSCGAVSAAICSNAAA
ncbi:DUF982 domain-containing protein [Ensifer adhaerens]|uniref:DUF982 domain-containing protein n=1 Tax=Ensifer adhaerens TaxID=106592 RepID=UPI003B82CD17